jgi:hypothetical protein
MRKARGPRCVTRHASVLLMDALTEVLAQHAPMALKEVNGYLPLQSRSAAASRFGMFSSGYGAQATYSF